MRSRGTNRMGAVCAIAGSLLLFIGTLLHPMDADPNQAAAAFAEYAADDLWIATHLTQLTGVALIVAALLYLAGQLKSGNAAAGAGIAAGAATASLAVAAALQAVDGIALRFMVNAWAAAAADEKAGLFAAAFAVRQIEIGLASIFGLFMGLTAIVYGVMLLRDGTYRKWVGGFAIAGGVPTMVGGIVVAYTGFSALAMSINMPASSVLLAWMLLLGVSMWRKEDGANQPQ